MLAKEEEMEMGRSARDKREERKCLTLLFGSTIMVDTEKATVFAIAEKNTAIHSPFLPLAVLPHQLDVAAALASSLLS